MGTHGLYTVSILFFSKFCWDFVSVYLMDYRLFCCGYPFCDIVALICCILFLKYYLCQQIDVYGLPDIIKLWYCVDK